LRGLKQHDLRELQLVRRLVQRLQPSQHPDIPQSYLEGGTLIKVALRAKNFIGHSVSTSYEVVISKDPIPYVAFQGGNKVPISGSVTLLRSIEIEAPSCLGVSQAILLSGVLKR
jgi:hypothetical protein